MDDRGHIYGDCPKCGATVYYDRACPNCGTQPGVAEALGEQLSNAIRDEVPDPLEAMRQQLREEHQRRQRKERGI